MEQLYTTFDSFLNESISFKDVRFNSHKNHNPYCDILDGKIDTDTQITYGIYVKNTKNNKKGDEFMEIYTGENYVVGSTKKSRSFYYTVDKIPSKYKAMWQELKKTYQEKYINEKKIS